MLSGKPWKPESVLFLFTGVLSSFFLASLASLLLKNLWADLSPADLRFREFLLGCAAFQILPLALVHVFLKQQDLTWGRFLGLDSPRLGPVLGRAVAVAMLAAPVALTLNQLSGLAITAIQDKPAEMQPAMQVLEISFTPVRRILFSLGAIVLAPIVEEILFRGVIYAFIKESGRPRLALWGSALFFAAIHGSTMTLIPLTFFAIVLTLLYERTGRLLAPILAHAGFNAANIIIYFLSRDAALR